MPKRLRPILLALILPAVLAVAGCGGSSGPDPSIPSASAQTLLNKIAEIKANVDVGSCLVAADKTNDLLGDIADLPSGVNSDVKQALDNGANNLELLLHDPDKCQGRSETTTTDTEPTTTEETTTERTQSTTKTQTTQTQTETTPTQTQTTPTQTQTTPGASGGIGPGGL